MSLGARQLVRELGKIVGRDNVLHHPEDLLVYEYDGSIDRSVPQVVVLPANTEEVSRVVALSYRHDIPVVGRGSGTGLSGGAIAITGGIQIALGAHEPDSGGEQGGPAGYGAACGDQPESGQPGAAVGDAVCA